MNTNRQTFKGETLAHGPMDTMSGKVTEARPRAKVYPVEEDKTPASNDVAAESESAE